MQIKTILRLLGLLLMLFSFSMLSPLLINSLFKEAGAAGFLYAFGLTFGSGSLLWALFRSHQQELKIRDGILIVVLFWFVLCFFGALPFLFALPSEPGLFSNAIFESVSGFTTTGASVFKDLNQLPRALLFYRQQLQFLGGMGIIVLAVAILPILGVGGMQLFRTETPGPMKDSKLTPRIKQSAKALWSIYFILTLACMLCYWTLGMSWFDALGESFSTVSTGGFAMHNTSFGFYHSQGIQAVGAFFMFLGSSNFALHFTAFKRRSLRHYWENAEFRAFLLIILIASLIISLNLAYEQPTGHSQSWINNLFNVVSLASTTGFFAEPLDHWPLFASFMTMILAIIGGCAGSTSGGLKVLRTLLVFKQCRREMQRLLHPHAIIPIKFGDEVLEENILQSMWGFLSVFIALFISLMLCLILLGNDFVSAFSATTAGLANAGAGIGSITVNFASLSTASKWLLMFAMLAGRLEIFALLILFSRPFWQR